MRISIRRRSNSIAASLAGTGIIGIISLFPATSRFSTGTSFFLWIGGHSCYNSAYFVVKRLEKSEQLDLLRCRLSTRCSYNQSMFLDDLYAVFLWDLCSVAIFLCRAFQVFIEEEPHRRNDPYRVELSFISDFLFLSLVLIFEMKTLCFRRTFARVFLLWMRSFLESACKLFPTLFEFNWMNQVALQALLLIQVSVISFTPPVFVVSTTVWIFCYAGQVFANPLEFAPDRIVSSFSAVARVVLAVRRLGDRLSPEGNLLCCLSTTYR
jgi:hypothetical protein